MSVIRFLLSMIPFTVPFWAVGVYLLYRGFTASPTALTDDGYDLKTFFFAMGGFFFYGSSIFVYFPKFNCRHSQTKQNQRNRDLLKTRNGKGFEIVRYGSFN